MLVSFGTPSTSGVKWTSQVDHPRQLSLRRCKLLYISSHNSLTAPPFIHATMRKDFIHFVHQKRPLAPDETCPDSIPRDKWGLIHLARIFIQLWWMRIIPIARDMQPWRPYHSTCAGQWGPLHTRDWRPVTVALSQFSLVERSRRSKFISH